MRVVHVTLHTFGKPVCSAASVHHLAARVQLVYRCTRLASTRPPPVSKLLRLLGVVQMPTPPPDVIAGGGARRAAGVRCSLVFRLHRIW